VQDSSDGEYSKCTVVIRKSTISDDIIHKQSSLINKMKQDNILVKRILDSKTTELAKIKAALEQAQCENCLLA
jgi:hypothetical protein